jgi:hypothetical protein
MDEIAERGREAAHHLAEHAPGDLTEAEHALLLDRTRLLTEVAKAHDTIRVLTEQLALVLGDVAGSESFQGRLNQVVGGSDMGPQFRVMWNDPGRFAFTCPGWPGWYVQDNGTSQRATDEEFMLPGWTSATLVQTDVLAWMAGVVLLSEQWQALTASAGSPRPRVGRVALILDSVRDLVARFLDTDRREDEELPQEDLFMAIESGEITIPEIVDEFRTQLQEQVSCAP